ncbi:MAG: hypothetical protein WAL80_21485 [Xanthobacteraceae bacterium]
MAVSVYIASLMQDDAGGIVAVVVIQPSDLAAFRVEIVFESKGNEESNLHYVRGVLQRFSGDLAEALKRPLKIVRKPAAKK